LPWYADGSDNTSAGSEFRPVRAGEHGDLSGCRVAESEQGTSAAVEVVGEGDVQLGWPPRWSEPLMTEVMSA
jgi:hypothetical protein